MSDTNDDQVNQNSKFFTMLGNNRHYTIVSSYCHKYYNIEYES